MTPHGLYVYPDFGENAYGARRAAGEWPVMVASQQQIEDHVTGKNPGLKADVNDQLDKIDWKKARQKMVEVSHEKEVAAAADSGRGVDRAREIDDDRAAQKLNPVAEQKLVQAHADALPPEYVGKVVGTQIDNGPESTGKVARTLSGSQTGKVVAAQVAHDPGIADAIAAEIPAEQAGRLVTAAVESGKVPKEVLLAATADLLGIPVDEFKKRLGL